MQEKTIVIRFTGSRHLGDVIRTARCRLGLTQEALAERMDTSDRSIRRIEAGVQSVDLRTVQRFARVLKSPRILKMAVEEIVSWVREPDQAA